MFMTVTQLYRYKRANILGLILVDGILIIYSFSNVNYVRIIVYYFYANMNQSLLISKLKLVLNQSFSRLIVCIYLQK